MPGARSGKKETALDDRSARQRQLRERTPLLDPEFGQRSRISVRLTSDFDVYFGGSPFPAAI